MIFSAGTSLAEQPAGTILRIAELEIDSAQLDAFKAAVTEGMHAAVRTEPGVIALYSVAVKDNPSQLRFIEIYANEEAYLRHRDTPHFRKYFETTQKMIRSRKLIETDTVLLADKATLPAAR
ncbi:antibiotic biosynthesis monooxygenase [Pectobacterium quasiaquaticum]|uniref:Antibiotic biosynthesis monooxygenase n=2 Tax=Pectobacterium quasiaquaticum TaxID=2774015 RepID=A0A9Q2EYW9_9GAMM|nr:antibiotic biosynthesis monooxygenase [Pectobacterium quasiaquaticum]